MNDEKEQNSLKNRKSHLKCCDLCDGFMITLYLYRQEAARWLQIRENGNCFADQNEENVHIIEFLCFIIWRQNIFY